MGLINSKRIIGVPVKTRDGVALGKVASLDFDADTGHLGALNVSTSFVSGLLNDELTIPWNQIISMSADQVIVSDLVVPTGARAAIA